MAFSSFQFIRLSAWLVALQALYGCDSKLTTEVAQGQKTSASNFQLTTLTAKPGEVVSFRATGLNAAQKNFIRFTDKTGKIITVPVSVRDASSGSFIMPDGVGLGLTDIALESNGTATTSPSGFVANLSTNTLPILIVEQSEICSSLQYIDKNGDTKTGTKNCSSGGATPNCSSDGEIGCVTTASFRAANMATATAANIKSGVTVAGILGQFPSATYTLPGSSGTDLTNPTFNAQLKSSATFQYFDSAGTRYTATGDTDISSSNIVNGIDIFGTTGSITTPSPWDLRAGVTAGGVTGKLKASCRNRVNLANIDMDLGRVVTGIAADVLTTASPHGLNNNDMVQINYTVGPTNAYIDVTYYVIYLTATTFQLSTSAGPGAPMSISGGTGITVHKWQDGNADVWDTIDDYNANGATMPNSVVAGWANYDCGGVEATAGDSNVWKDVTTSNGVAASSCATTASNCAMQDKISGLWWSKDQTATSWNQALIACNATFNSTTYPGNSSPGFNGQTGWRLPTQKEMLEAYTHGIRSAASSNWITLANMGTWFWSATSLSDPHDSVWTHNLRDGSNGGAMRDDSWRFTCVRP